jgi:hypothetical protein
MGDNLSVIFGQAFPFHEAALLRTMSIELRIEFGADLPSSNPAKRIKRLVYVLIPQLR